MESARIIEDIYEVASVVLSDDSIVRTMATPHAVGRCPLSAGLLSFILCEKYAYHSSINTVKKKLRHVGCWAHARRLFIEAYESEKSACRDVINDVGDLFSVELNAKLTKIDPGDIERLRKTESNSILTRIYTRVKTMSKNHVLMSNVLMKKAVNYLLNLWQSLRNFIMDGRVQISNNLCEQRMKTIKLDLKNCQNIGSEDAAMKSAFMHSLIESCSLNKLNPESYLTHLFECHKRPDVVDKTALLPCYYTNKT